MGWSRVGWSRVGWSRVGWSGVGSGKSGLVGYAGCKVNTMLVHSKPCS